MTAEVLKNGGSEWDKLVDEMEAEFKKYDDYLANRDKTAAEVSGRSTLCGTNLF